MACIASIQIEPIKLAEAGEVALWARTAPARDDDKYPLPNIFWASGAPWSQANLWAFCRDNRTISARLSTRSDMFHLLAYANWLESMCLTWDYFPRKNSERCLTRFRGELIKCRNEGLIAPSTASARMAAVIRFYRWASEKTFVGPVSEMWKDKEVIGNSTSRIKRGLAQTVLISELRIPNRRIPGFLELEDGISPISIPEMIEVLQLAEQHAPAELNLMLRIGFFTGLRISSICDLKIENIDASLFDARLNCKRIQVGPRARPPVRTKFDTSGSVIFPLPLINEIREYLSTTRSLSRRMRANANAERLIFLTKTSSGYESEDSRAFAMMMSRFRKNCEKQGKPIPRGFHFHQTRATFATNLMRFALKHYPISDAIGLVREACMHQSETTTMQYVRLINTSATSEALAREFDELFRGTQKLRLSADAT